MNSVQIAPDPWEPEENFSFISETTEVFSSSSSSLKDINTKVHLITTAGKYGYVFLSDQSIIKVFQTSSIIDEKDSKPFKVFDGRGRITYLAASCDSQTLLVVTVIKETSYALFYDIFSLISMSIPPSPFYFSPLSAIMGSSVISVAWNPCDSCCVVIVLSNGDIILIKIKDSSVEFNTQKGVNASAVTWSAKGKQLAVGKIDGSVALLKPDLTPVRNIECPPQKSQIGSVISLTWFTNTEFFIGYLCNKVSPTLFYVNAPKGKPAIYFTFEDVCYSNEKRRPVTYYTHFFNEWNLLLILSTHGVEMGLIGKTASNVGGDCTWCQWFPDDGARASMNFMNVTEETYPLGIALDLTSTRTMIAKDESVQGPFPVVLALSTGGELNSFFVKNRIDGCSKLTIVKDLVPMTGFRTPQQYGQQPLPPPEPVPVINLDRSASSAFSSVSVKPSAFSTPIKPSSESLQKVSFSSPFMTKPVSISNEVGSSRSTILHVPSPKKTISPAPIASPQPILSVLPTVQLKPNPLNFNVSQSQHKSPLDEPPVSKIANLNSQNQQVISNNEATTTTIQVPVKLIPKTVAPKVSKEKLIRVVQEEINHFDGELQNFIKSSAAVKYQVGKKGDESKENSHLSAIKSWMTEMKNTTSEQSEEISQLHEKTFEALASYEDANAHKKCSARNKMYLQLRPLDPYSQRRLNELRTKFQYLLSQLSDGNIKLDLLWEQHSCNKKIFRQEQASAKNLCRSVLNLQNARITYEKQLETICHRFKHISISSFNPSFTTDTSSYQAENFKHDQISPKKSNHLAEILSQRSITPIRKRIESSYKKVVANQDKLCRGSHSFAIDNIPVYDEISPPDSPQKSISECILPHNPLGALSSLVDNVAEGKENSSLFGSKISPMASLFSPNIKDVSVPSGSIFNFGQKQSDPAMNTKGISPSSLFKTGLVKEKSPSCLFGSSDSPKSESQLASLLLKTSMPQSISTSQGNLNFSNILSQPKATASKALFKSQNNTSSQSFESSDKTALLGQNTSTPCSNSSSLPIFSTTLGSSSKTDGKISSTHIITKDNKNSSAFTQTTNKVTSSKSLFGMLSDNDVSISASQSQKTSLFQIPTSIAQTESIFNFKNVSSTTQSQGGSLFGQSTLTTQSQSSSPFCLSPATTQSQSSSLFGQSTLPTQSQSSSPFGRSTETTLSQSSSLFGQSTLTTQSQSSSQFGLSTATTPSQSSSLFGQSTFTTQSQSSSQFGISTVTTPSQSSSLFGQSTFTTQSQSSSPFGLSTATTPSQSSSLFGQSTASALSQNSSLFSQSSASTLSQSKSLFGQPISTTLPQSSSLFGPASSIAQSQSSSLFGQSTSITLSPSSSLFGQSTSTQSTSSSNVEQSSQSLNSLLFGKATMTTQSPSSPLCAQSTIPQIEGNSLFDKSISTSSLVSNTLSGQTSSIPQSQSSSLLGQPASTVSLQGSTLFDKPVSILQSQDNVQSTISEGHASKSLPFEHQQSSAVTQTQPLLTDKAQKTVSLFGQSTTTVQDQNANSSLIGQSSITQDQSITTSAAFPQIKSLLGQATATSVQPQSGSLFNQSTPSSQSQTDTLFVNQNNSIFNQATTTDHIQSNSSLFNAPAPSNSSSLPFGQPASLSSSSIFGGPVTSGSQSTSLFGQSAPAETSSIFGQGQSNVAPKSAFGQPTTSSSSIFGGQTGFSSSSSIFGNSCASPSKSVFGNNTAFGSNTTFGEPTVSGSSSSVFGSASTFGNQNPSSFVFGTTSSGVFGGGNVATTATITSNSQSLFSSGFGQQLPTSAASPLFSGDSMFGGLGKPLSQENNSKNVFGATPVQTSGINQTNLFGGTANSPFGSKPVENNAGLSPKPGGAFSPVKSAFGASAAFGSGPTFGGSPAFGSPPAGSTFGGSSFGAAAPGGSTIFGGSSSAFGSGGGTATAFGSPSNTGASGSFSNFSAATEGATFGALANKTSADENVPSSFGGKSFSSWR